MSHATSPASSAVADAVEAQSPSLPPAAGARRPTRNRKAYSCTECRRRKKHCDRRVPGCNQCILRDTVHLCRWGDERDDDVVEQQQQQQPRPSSSMMQEGSTSTARGSEHRYHQRLPAHAQRSRSQSPPARTGWSRPQSHTPGTPHAWLTPEERCHVGRDSNPFGNANPLGETTSRSNEPASSPHETFSNSRRSTLSAHLSMRSPPSNSTDRARLEQEEQSILMSELSRAELDIGLDPSPVSQQDAFRTSMSSSRTTLPTHSTSKSDDHWRITPTDRSALTRSAQASDDAPIAGHPQLPQRRRSGKFSSASASTPQSNKGAVAPTRSGEKPLLTFAQATELFHLYKSLSNRLLMIETSEVKAALEEGMASLPPAGGGNIAEMRERVPDTYALLLVICASALSKMPSTYAITMGLVGRCESIPSLMQDLFRTAMQVIDSMPAPTFISIQARNLFQHNLTPALSAKSHLKILDRLIREARSLGLDRLGSPADDEALWRKRDEERDLQREHHEEVLHGQRTVNPGNEVLWAADTFRRRDRRARNLGRAHWMFLRAKDWVTSRIVGCYMVPDKSYTTSLPMPYTDRSEDLITETDKEIFLLLETGIQSSRRYSDLCSEAQSIGETIDYDKILELDADLMEAIYSRPPYLRPEERGGDMMANSPEALLVSSTLWHRIFVIHRPFLMLSRTHPERYGLSASRSWDYALLTIKTMRMASMSMVKYWPPLHFRVMQAALVLISHLFIWPHHMTMEQTIAIHDELNWVVMTLEALEPLSTQGSVFAGTGARIEALIAAASRIKRARGKVLSLHDSEGSIGGMAAPWIQRDANGTESASDISDGAMKLAARLASEGRQSQRRPMMRNADTRSRSTGYPHDNSDQNWPATDGPGQPSHATPVDLSAASIPMLGALDEQLVRLMGESTNGWEERAPVEEMMSANPLGDNSPLLYGGGAYAFGTANGSGNNDASYGLSNGSSFGMGRDNVPSGAVAGAGAGAGASESSDVWADIFAYVDAATASLPSANTGPSAAM